MSSQYYHSLKLTAYLITSVFLSSSLWAQDESAVENVTDPVAEATQATTASVDELVDEVAEPAQAATTSVEELVDQVPEEAAPKREVRRLGIDTSDEFSLDLSAPIALAPTAADIETPDVTLPNSEQDSQLQDVLVRLALDPEDTEALTERNSILDDVIQQANIALASNNINLARRLAAAVRTVNKDHVGLADLDNAINAKLASTKLLATAAESIAAGQFFGPAENNAFSIYSSVLSTEPDNPEAVTGMATLLTAVTDAAKLSAANGDYQQALSLLKQAEAIPQSEALLATARVEVNDLLANVISQMHASVLADIDASNFDAAETKINQMVSLGADATDIEKLRISLLDARRYGSLTPGQKIQDTFSGPIRGTSPALIVIPAGEFMMGSDPADEDSAKNEQPMHKVIISRGFAIAEHEVTVAEFKLFMDNSSYKTDAERLGKSRVYDEASGTILERENVNWKHDYHGNDANLNLPVIHVSWDDASAYAKWLTDNTDRNYHLPSEAEFEYALRAGTLSKYWWGNGAPDTPVENVTGDRDKPEVHRRDRAASARRWTGGFKRVNDGYWGPAPVASFAANAFGLHDMGGNVSEWVEDCWHKNYVEAPVDGSAWLNSRCHRRVIRGASWSSTPKQARSASRFSAGSTSRFSRVGFRIVRDL